MRFLLLGGSNTNHFGPQFITAVEARKADGRFNSDSYVQNESIGGSGIKPNLDKRYELLYFLKDSLIVAENNESNTHYY